MSHGLEYFKCMSLKCTMRYDVCLVRQERARSEDIREAEKFEFCSNCEQGLQIAVEQAQISKKTEKANLVDPPAQVRALETEPVLSKQCIVDECELGHSSRGFCGRHYAAWREGRLDKEKYGEWTPARPVKATFDTDEYLVGQQKKLDEKRERLTGNPYGSDKNAGVRELPKRDKVDTDRLILMLEDYPDVLPNLTDAAKLHIRTVMHQALFYIVRGLQKNGFVKKTTDDEEREDTDTARAAQ